MCVKGKSLIEPRCITFGHTGDATLVVFKAVAVDNWPADLKVTQEANGVTYFLYSFTVVLFGAFFAMNSGGPCRRTRASVLQLLVRAALAVAGGVAAGVLLLGRLEVQPSRVDRGGRGRFIFAL